MTPGSIDEAAAWYRYSYSRDIMTPVVLVKQLPGIGILTVGIS